MSTVSGTRRAARRQSHDGSADKVLVTLEATPPVAGNRRGAPTPVPGARNSPIDVEAIEDEVQAVSPSRVPPPRRKRRTRREPITAVDLEVEVIWAGNKRQRVQRLSPDVGAGSSLQVILTHWLDIYYIVGDVEQRLRAALRHLQVDAGVLERLVYKHRNQHRGAAYFQYLLKVRRDLKLLLGAGLAEVLNAVFPVLACRKPANTILVPAKQTKKKPGANHSHHERLLGVARLLSQMSEPVMKAAIQITFLLARSFFVDLCTAVFSLLARVRVLIQQMLLDVVSIYNKVTDLTDRKQAVKISISGVQAFREYYPSMNDACTILECVWVKDKFVLHEKVKDICQETQVEDQKCCDPESSIQYDTVALISEDMKSLEETNPPASQPDASLAEQPDKMINCNDAGDTQKGRQLENETSACSVPDTLSTHEHLKPETRKRVAFVAVGNPKAMGAASGTKSSEVNKKQRLDMISPSNIQSGLYNKLLDCETTENTIL